jgi:hypothetical protein
MAVSYNLFLKNRLHQLLIIFLSLLVLPGCKKKAPEKISNPEAITNNNEKKLKEKNNFIYDSDLILSCHLDGCILLPHALFSLCLKKDWYTLCEYSLPHNGQTSIKEFILGFKLLAESAGWLINDENNYENIYTLFFIKPTKILYARIEQHEKSFIVHNTIIGHEKILQKQ